MPVIKLNEKRFSLRPGSNRLGMGDVEIPIDGAGVAGAIAVIDVTPTGTVIRPGTEGGTVRVNGIALVDPVPLLHGDKLEVAGQELQFGDESADGKTQYVASEEVKRAAAEPVPVQIRAAPSGGRLVSLVDGKEYSVGPAGVTIGLDAGSDIVVAERQVSRKHAVVTPTPRGYEIQDLSSNGVYVNGTRVSKAQILARSDVIRVGTEEFRFHADVIALAPTVEFAAVSHRLTEPGGGSVEVTNNAILPQSFRRPEPARRSEASAKKRQPSATPSRLARAAAAAATAERQIPPTPARASGSASAVARPRREGNLSWLWLALLAVLAVSAIYFLTK
jgi:pSer/pThr/pTyr-binding forkhead associated (FHA) protein